MEAYMKVNQYGNTLQFTFDGLESITFNADANPKLHNAAMMHGFEQKIRDNAAIARKQKDGTVITVTEAMRREAVAEMVKHLETSDSWNMARREATLNPAIAALAQRLGKSYAEAMVYLANEAMQKLDEQA